MNLNSIIFSLLILSVIIYYITNSLIKIEPTFKGILIKFGKRTDKILNEGYHFIIPIVHNIVVIDCKRTTKNFRINEIFTPNDQAEIVVDIETTWFPHDLSLFFETKNPIEQLEGMIAEAIRGFVSDKFTKPRQWDEAAGMGEKFSRMIVAKLMGFEIPRYEKDSISHKKGEHKLESDMTPEELKNKKNTIGMVNLLKTGKGELQIPGIGVTITRFNIKAVEPSKTLRESLEKISMEKQQQIAEVIEARTTAKLIQEFLLSLGYSENEISNPRKINEIFLDMGISIKDILRMFRIEREKSDEQIYQVLADDNILNIIKAMLPNKFTGDE